MSLLDPEHPSPLFGVDDVDRQLPTGSCTRGTRVRETRSEAMPLELASYFPAVPPLTA